VEIALAERRMVHADEYRPECGQLKHERRPPG
jgi:hypothetical protein